MRLRDQVAEAQFAGFPERVFADAERLDLLRHRLPLQHLLATRQFDAGVGDVAEIQIAGVYASVVEDRLPVVRERQCGATTARVRFHVLAEIMHAALHAQAHPARIARCAPNPGLHDIAVRAVVLELRGTIGADRLGAGNGLRAIHRHV